MSVTEERTAYKGLPVIVGSGIAGMVAALSYEGPCVLCASARVGEETSSALAQGGIAAVLSATDNVESHVADTLRAGAGLCDPLAVQYIIEQGGEAISYLQSCGIVFDTHEDGTLDLHLEAAHTYHRIAHIGGDRTGAALIEGLGKKIRNTPSIHVLENTHIHQLWVEEGKVYGVSGTSDLEKEESFFISTTSVILAGGGMGALYSKTTNPASVAGHSMAMAARVGAVLADMEFIQFHPTAFAPPEGKLSQRLSLISEAVRGAGGILVDETGHRFTDELQPRDIVTRALWKHIQAGHTIFLDATRLSSPSMEMRFPGITRICRAHAIDPMKTPIPVTPAAHYTMGGIKTDMRGRSSIDGLWAIGECASTGLHGANRLASNSLLETVVMGRQAAWDVKKNMNTSSFKGKSTVMNPSCVRSIETQTMIADIMNRDVGIVRHEQGLKKALSRFIPFITHDNRALLAAMVAWSALNRKESRGAHFRGDYPTSEEEGHRTFLTAQHVLEELNIPS